MALSKQEREQAALLLAQGKKRCSKCKHVKDLGDFDRSNRLREAVSTGRVSECKHCRGQRAAADRKADPSKYHARNTSYYRNNQAKEREKVRMWRAAHPEEYKAQQDRSLARRSPLYFIWWGIKQRCENPGFHSYARYGGRGIRVYPEWRDDFRAFEAWINENLGPRPAGKTKRGAWEHTLDRWPDNDGNYEPGNVRWADRQGQYDNQTHPHEQRDALEAQLAAALDEIARLEAELKLR